MVTGLNQNYIYLTQQRWQKGTWVREEELTILAPKKQRKELTQLQTFKKGRQGRSNWRPLKIRRINKDLLQGRRTREKSAEQQSRKVFSADIKCKALLEISQALDKEWQFHSMLSAVPSSPLAVPTYTIHQLAATSPAAGADNVLPVQSDPIQCWHELQLLVEAILNKINHLKMLRPNGVIGYTQLFFPLV